MCILQGAYGASTIDKTAKHHLAAASCQTQTYYLIIQIISNIFIKQFEYTNNIRLYLNNLHIKLIIQIVYFYNLNIQIINLNNIRYLYKYYLNLAKSEYRRKSNIICIFKLLIYEKNKVGGANNLISPVPHFFPRLRRAIWVLPMVAAPYPPCKMLIFRVCGALCEFYHW